MVHQVSQGGPIKMKRGKISIRGFTHGTAQTAFARAVSFLFHTL